MTDGFHTIVLKEAGLGESLLGMSLSYNSPVEKMPTRASLIAPLDKGHNKFLESIAVWLDVRATRGWWQQMATYRIGTTTQSESTMHTLMKRHITREDCSSSVDDRIIAIVNSYIDSGNLKEVSDNLPEGFYQRRIICTNYKALRNMWQQRHEHKREEWIMFCNELVNQLQFPKYIME